MLLQYFHLLMDILPIAFAEKQIVKVKHLVQKSDSDMVDCLALNKVECLVELIANSMEPLSDVLKPDYLALSLENKMAVGLVELMERCWEQLMVYLKADCLVVYLVMHWGIQ